MRGPVESEFCMHIYKNMYMYILYMYIYKFVALLTHLLSCVWDRHVLLVALRVRF